MMALLKNITFRSRLYILSASLTFFLLISTVVAIFNMDKIGQEIIAIADHDIPLTEVVTQIDINQLNQAIVFERNLRYGLQMQNNNKAQEKFVNTSKTFERFNAQINAEISKGKQLANTAKLNAYSEQDKKEFEHVEILLTQIEQQHKVYEQHVHEVFNAFTKRNIKHALQLANKVEHEEEKISHELHALLTELEKFTAHAAHVAASDEKAAVNILLSVSAVAILFGIYLSFIIAKSMNMGLSAAIRTAETIATGDLTVKVPSCGKNEIGRLLAALNTMRESLYNIVNELSSSATQLTTASEELSTVSEVTNENLHAQHAEVDQAATAVNEMTLTIQEVARNAVATSATAQQTQTTTGNGKRIVEDTIGSLDNLANAVENSAKVIHDLDTHSNNIGSVLDVIKNIAEQTNLLALNAAIEAARAGEQGRGFAVVADEVRTLASRTQDSTTEIESMIEKLQTGAKHAVNVMDTGREQASDSVEQAKKAGVALSEITQAVAHITDMNTQIASAAEEQAAVADEINKNIVKINSLSEENADAVNETTQSSVEMTKLAAHLHHLMENFRIA